MIQNDWDQIRSGSHVYEVVANYAIRRIEYVGDLPSLSPPNKAFFSRGNNELLRYGLDNSDNLFLSEIEAIEKAVDLAKKHIDEETSYASLAISDHIQRLSDLEVKESSVPL